MSDDSKNCNDFGLVAFSVVLWHKSWLEWSNRRFGNDDEPVTVSHLENWHQPHKIDEFMQVKKIYT